MQTPSSEKLERILASLDEAQRVPAPPYFYTRLRARLQEAPSPQQQLLWLRPLPAVAMLVVLLLLNFWLLNTPAVDSTTPTPTTKTVVEDELQVLAFEDRTAEHMIADYEVTVDPPQK
ncbi:MAG: hypothetical protein ACKOC7_08545 [Sphingomonadales bacterium]